MMVGNGVRRTLCTIPQYIKDKVSSALVPIWFTDSMGTVIKSKSYFSWEKAKLEPKVQLSKSVSGLTDRRMSEVG